MHIAGHVLDQIAGNFILNGNQGGFPVYHYPQEELLEMVNPFGWSSVGVGWRLPGCLRSWNWKRDSQLHLRSHCTSMGASIAADESGVPLDFWRINSNRCYNHSMGSFSLAPSRFKAFRATHWVQICSSASFRLGAPKHMRCHPQCLPICIMCQGTFHLYGSSGLRLYRGHSASRGALAKLSQAESHQTERAYEGRMKDVWRTYEGRMGRSSWSNGNW